MSPKWDDAMTLGRARRLLEKAVVDRGETLRCPCCNRLAKVYHFQINHTMVRNLAESYRRHGVLTPFRLIDMNGAKDRREANFAKLRHWGLIKQAPPLERQDGGHAGWWVVTKKGRSWLKGRRTVSRYVLLYQNAVIGFDGEEWSAVEASKHKFDLQELMA